jgi:hypothetical protein
LISSAIISWQKTGPGTKRNWRRPPSLFGSQDIGRHQVGRELHALFLEAQHPAQRAGKLGLGKAGRTHQQGMAAAENGDQHLFHHLVLAEDDLADGGAHLGQALAHGLEIGENLAVCFIDAGHDAHYSCFTPILDGGTGLLIMTSS